MLRRRLFFLFEKLQITPAERKSVAALLTLLVVLSTANLLLEPPAPYDAEYYRELDQQFDSLSSAPAPVVPGMPAPATAGGSTVPAASLATGPVNLMFGSAGRAAPDTVTSDTLTADSLASDSLHSDGDDPRPPLPQKININTADDLTLQELPGIGPVYASRIIAWRNNFGPFETVEELLHIKGIGEKRLEKIKPFIKLRE